MYNKNSNDDENISTIINYSKADKVKSWDAPLVNNNNTTKSANTNIKKETSSTTDEEEIQKGYEAGFSQGKQDGLSAGQTETQLLRQKIRAELTIINQLVLDFKNPLSDLDKCVIDDLIYLARKIAEQIIFRETSIDKEIIVKIIKNILPTLPTNSNEVRIYLNPNDIKSLSESNELDNYEFAIDIVESSDIRQGGCKLTTSISSIDATVEKRIEDTISQLITEIE